MKKRFIKVTSLSNKILMSAIALLGFNSCDNEPSVEYGTPHATYEVKGMVTDQNGTPIPGIQVNLDVEKPYTEQTKAITDNQGKYTVSEETFPKGALTITATDIDGEKNGSFETKTQAITFTKEDQVEKGSGWNDGKFAKEVNIKMEAKK